jgi:hypothetical protein
VGAYIDCITIDCADARRVATFWAEALGYEVRAEKGGWIVLAPPHGGRPLVAFDQVPESKLVKNRVHVDLFPTEGSSMEAEVGRLEGLGGRQVRLVDEEDSDLHVIMADPEGNECCVIQP